MKIHLWAPGFAGFGGGITAFSRELALALKEHGHEVRLFGKLDHTGAWPGFQLWGTAHYAGSLRTARFAAGGLSSAARHQPDYIISTHVNFGPAAHLAKKLVGTRYALVAHGIDIHPDLPPATVAAIRAADRIIAVSAWTRERLLRLGGIDPARVAILPNTVDESRFAVGPKPSSLYNRYDIRPDAKVVLSVARLDPMERYKGYDRLVHALPRLADECGPVHLLIVGEGADKARVHALSQVLGVERFVTLAGFVPDEELADHYRLADVFAMPSTGEGFGIVFLEAMSCGTPVVAGNRDGSVDAVADGELGQLVDPENIDSLVRGVSRILCCEGEPFWYDREELHARVIARFGRNQFRRRLSEIIYGASRSSERTLESIAG